LVIAGTFGLALAMTLVSAVLDIADVRLILNMRWPKADLPTTMPAVANPKVPVVPPLIAGRTKKPAAANSWRRRSSVSSAWFPR